MKKTLLSMATASAIVMLFAVSACKKSSTSPTNANVLVVHASPDAPAVDIYVNGSKAATGLAYLSNTGYVAVASGATNIKVDPTGTTSPVINANVTLAANANYSVFAIDSVADIQPLVLVDTLTIPSGASVRFVHLSPNAPAVDVVDSASGTMLVNNVSFKGYTSFTALPAGTYTLNVQPHGSGITALSVPGVTVSAGHIYTIIARGFLGGTGSQAIGASIIENK